jgi:propionyl-CoA carboxylase alpha chain
LTWELSAEVDNIKHDVVVTYEPPVGVELHGNWNIAIDGQTRNIPDNFALSDPFLECELSKGDMCVQMISRQPNGDIRLQYMGTIYDIQILPARNSELYQFMPEKPEIDTAAVLIAPMPGLVKSVNVAVGDKVTADRR